jgi:hypothetical protein
MGVPEEERLRGTGWIASFNMTCVMIHSFAKPLAELPCFSYNIRMHRLHGEAASADLDAVRRERERVTAILSEYDEEDQWNTDETAFCGR